MAKKVIIIGGGIAGLSAAHELIERGFAVEVYESHPIHAGGKARSEDALVAGFNLLGEHGFRFFPGFYRHMFHTMKRIPFGNGTVYQNLVRTDVNMFARRNQEPLKIISHFPWSAFDLDILFQTLNGNAANTGLNSEESQFFKEKIIQLLLSSKTRFKEEYEYTGWWYFLEAGRFTPVYQNLLADGLTRTLVAAQARTMSTRVGGSIILQLIYSLADPTLPTDRILNGPTNISFLIPWKDYLVSRGVNYNQNHEVQALNMAADLISEIIVLDKTTNRQLTIRGDYYLLAVPVEKAQNLISNAITNTDPFLANVANLAADVKWMNGVQFFLNRSVPITPGHVSYINSEWAITSISQDQYWSQYNISGLTGGTIKGILSVDLSNWDGVYNGILARASSEQDLISGIYQQLQQHLSINGIALIPVNMNDVVVGYHIGSSINIMGGNILANNEPLLVNVVNGWSKMPKSWSSIKNLFLAGDYVRTNTNLATMEAANESARRAVNGIIDASNERLPYAKVWKLRSWKMVMPYQWYDRKRFEKGLPYSNNFPWWLRVVAFIWTAICILFWVFKRLFTGIFGRP